MVTRGRKAAPHVDGFVSFPEAKNVLGSGFNPYSGKYITMAVEMGGYHYFKKQYFDETIKPHFKKRGHKINSMEELASHVAPRELPAALATRSEPAEAAPSHESFMYPIGIKQMVHGPDPRLSKPAKNILQSLGDEGSKKVDYVIRCILGGRPDDGDLAIVNNFARLLEVYDSNGEPGKKDYFVRNLAGLEIFGTDVRSRAACKNMLTLGIGGDGVDEEHLMSLYAQAGNIATGWKAEVRNETMRRRQEASISRSHLK